MKKHEEMTINERLEYLVKHEGMNVNSFSVKLGVHPTLVRNTIQGKSQPSYETIMKLLDVYKLSSDWLLRGIGNMYIDGTGNEVIETSEEGTRAIDELLTELNLYRKREEKFIETISNLAK